MQTLASCKPSEFLRQAYKIRKAVSEWIDLIDFVELYKRKPQLIILTDSMSKEEREEAFEENAKRSREAIKQNTFDILDAIMAKHPDETLKVLALCCFVEPSDVDSYSVREYLTCLTELINDEAVLGFFTSLGSLQNRPLLKA